MNTVTAARKTISNARFARLAALIDRWRATWRHALAVYYRKKGGWFLTPRLGSRGAALVWGLFLGGTALGVAAYPDATQVECDWYTCHYRLLERLGGSPFDLFNQRVEDAFLAIPCTILPILLVLLLMWTVFQGLRGRLNPLPKGTTLANIWHNGVAAMLVITPLGADGMVRVRFLTRLYNLWRHRYLFAALIGVLAALIVSQHVVRPIFWWLGPWGHWVAQLALVLLWCGVAVVWLANLAAYATLQEVTFSPKRSEWRACGAAMVLVMVVTPLIVSRLYFSTFAYLSYHDANTLSVVSAPLILLILGPVFMVCNYLAAQVVFRLRTRNLSSEG